MGMISELYKNLIEKVKAMSTGRKIAFSIMLIGIIVFIILYASYTSTNKYGVLFSGLTPEDGKMISDKLKADKVTTQIKGTTIYVPKD